jgi:hypothetical protein
LRTEAAAFVKICNPGDLVLMLFFYSNFILLTPILRPIPYTITPLHHYTITPLHHYTRSATV